MERKLIIINNNDNVAIALKNVKKDEIVYIDGYDQRIKLQEDIPFGHKVAIKEIDAGEEIIKYGESIGRAKFTIQLGYHVHIHNVESQRGRGDTEK
jgi:altronate dehydratase small subunit